MGVSNVNGGQILDCVGAAHVMQSLVLDCFGVSDVLTDVIEYRLYHRLGSPVTAADLLAAPWATSATLPITEALTGQGLHYFILRQTNKFGLESQNLDQTIIELDGSDNELTLSPTVPYKVTLRRASANMMTLRATYQHLRDGLAAATDFKVWLTSDGTDPDPLVDPVTATVPMVKADSLSKLIYSSGPYSEGQTIKAIVRTYRSSDGRDDGNTTIITATTTAIGPLAAAPASYHRYQGVRKRGA